MSIFLRFLQFYKNFSGIDEILLPDKLISDRLEQIFKNFSETA